MARRYPLNFSNGECLDGDPRYSVVDRNPSSETAEPVGYGGAGVVFRAVYKRRMERALKFLSPDEELTHVETPAFEKTFLREIGVLVQLRHTNLANITDFGKARVGGHEVLWMAMDFVDGETLKDLVRDARLPARDFLTIYGQLLNAVQYLHDQGVMHCDIKTSNVMVRDSGADVSTTLLDLGVAKVFPVAQNAGRESGRERAAALAEELAVDSGRDLSAESDDTYFVATKRIIRPEWQTRSGNIISRTELDEMFPSHDLYTLGFLLGEVLEQPEVASRLASDLGSAGFKALELMRDRLRTDKKEEDYYRSVHDVRRDWNKLAPGYLSPLGVPELATANAKTSLSIPSTRVSLTSRFDDVVNHPLFQRLHEIPQLEFVHLALAGARHTRFLHSLQVFDLAGRYVTHLLGDVRFRLTVEPSDVEALLLRALLHDIGRYPLSHMFEDFSVDERLAGRPRRVPSDDELFWEFVGTEADEVSPAFSSFSEIIDKGVNALTGGAEPPLRELLREDSRFGADTLEAIKGLVHPRSESHAILAGILSSPVDADKVSYLRDDSLMTGVRYGRGIDVEGLLVGLRTPDPGDLYAQGRLRPTIALRDKSLAAAESVLLARMWMFQRVYRHHTSRAVTAMVKFVIGELLDKEGAFDMGEYISETLFSPPAEALRLLKRWFDENIGGPEAGITNPLDGLIGGQRRPYKRLLTITAAGEDRETHDRLANRDVAGLRTLADRATEFLRDWHPACAEMLPGDLILDVPAGQRDRHEGRALVYFDRNPQPGRSLTDDPDLSPTLRAVREEYLLYVSKARIYIHPRFSAALDDDTERGARVELRKHLDELLDLHA